jgi:hypothetical protein
MTVLNVHVARDRVLVCTDSEVVSPDRKIRGERSKLLYLAHANIVMAGRGVQLITLGLFEGAWMNLTATLDSLEDSWTNEALDSYRAHVFARLENDGIDLGSATGAELLVAGYSRRRDRMIALHYLAPSGSGFTKCEVDEWYLAPNCDLVAAPAMDSITSMAALARRQIAHWKPRAPNEGFGGRLVFATLDRDGASFTTMAV